MNYPHLCFKKRWKIDNDVVYLLGQCELLVEIISETPLQPEIRRQLAKVSLIKGAQATTAIEGNTLSEDEISNILSDQKKLPESMQYQQQEVTNIIKGMNDLLDKVIDGKGLPGITPELLKEFHYKVGHDIGEQFAAEPGKFSGSERVVGRYKCPAPKAVPGLVKQLYEWLDQEFGSGKQDFGQAVIAAIVAHVYIEWIHPFNDGNGRVGRLVEFYLLLHAGLPDITSHVMSNHYNKTRSEYYRQLEYAKQKNDLTQFIRYASQGFFDGLMDTWRTVNEAMVQHVWRSYVYEKFSQFEGLYKTVFKRRRTLILAMEKNQWYTLDKLPDLSIKVAFVYAKFDKPAMMRTIKRDIAFLIDEKLLVKGDDKRYKVNSVVLRW